MPRWIFSDFGLESQWSACHILITHLMLEKCTFFYNLWSMQNRKMIILFDPASATSKNFKYHSRRKPATHTHILQYVICQCKNLLNNTKSLTVGNGSIILWHLYYCYFIIGNYILNSKISPKFILLNFYFAIFIPLIWHLSSAGRCQCQVL